MNNKYSRAHKHMRNNYFIKCLSILLEIRMQFHDTLRIWQLCAYHQKVDIFNFLRLKPQN